MDKQNKRGRTNALIGMALMALGVFFLLGQVFQINLWRFLWPFFVIVPGLLFFVGMTMGGKPAGPLAIPGAIVTSVGLLLLYQSVTGHWESWAYGWALIFPTAVGVGLVINGTWSDVDSLVGTGMNWVKVGLGIFFVGGIFFELLLNISNSIIGNVFLPLLLIGGGVFLLMRRAQNGDDDKPPSGDKAPTPVKEIAPKSAEPEFRPIGTPEEK